MASEWMRCAKSLATLRSLLVFSRWIIVYCFANISSKHAGGPDARDELRRGTGVGLPMTLLTAQAGRRAGKSAGLHLVGAVDEAEPLCEQA
eukprot:scaffold7350_cov121-Isochrysis_galbana.AAC.1